MILEKTSRTDIKFNSKTSALFVCMFLQWLRSDFGELWVAPCRNKVYRKWFSKTSRHRRLFPKSTHWSCLRWAGFDLIFSNIRKFYQEVRSPLHELVFVQIISIPRIREECEPHLYLFRASMFVKGFERRVLRVQAWSCSPLPSLASLKISEFFQSFQVFLHALIITFWSLDFSIHGSRTRLCCTQESELVPEHFLSSL